MRPRDSFFFFSFLCIFIIYFNLLQDIGYFLSPGDRSYDAIGLMKQLSEHTAAAFADAQEVLGDETPETILKGRCSKNQNLDQLV